MSTVILTIFAVPTNITILKLRVTYSSMLFFHILDDIKLIKTMKYHRCKYGSYVVTETHLKRLYFSILNVVTLCLEFAEMYSCHFISQLLEVLPLNNIEDATVF